MKFMVSWSISPGSYKAAVERFLGTGAPMPEGLERIGRWHAPGSTRGWLLVEGDAAGVAEHVAQWADLLELQVSPVIEDEAAGAAVSRVYG